MGQDDQGDNNVTHKGGQARRVVPFLDMSSHDTQRNNSKFKLSAHAHGKIVQFTHCAKDINCPCWQPDQYRCNRVFVSRKRLLVAPAELATSSLGSSPSLASSA